MKLYTAALAFITIFTVSVPSQATATHSKSMLFRDFGICAAGVFSAFDILNKAILFSKLDAQSAGCQSTNCTASTREQQVLNAVGIGFAVAPPIAAIATLAVHGCHSSTCLLFYADDARVFRVTAVSSLLALAGSAVALGTSAKGLTVAASLSASSTQSADLGAWIASIALEAMATISGAIAVLTVSRIYWG